jgi:rhodanese-related sulfurtransferase
MKRLKSSIPTACPFVSPIAIMALAACFSPDYSQLSDTERNATVQSMYEGYRAETFPEVKTAGSRQVAEWLERGEAVLVDVRTPEERAVSTLPGAIPADEFEAHIDEFRDQRIVTYCTIGYRSGVYCKEMGEAAAGLDLYNLEGSVLAWAHAGLPFHDPNGVPTRRVHVYGPTWDLLPQAYESVY